MREREREREIYFSDIMNDNSLLTTITDVLLPFPPITIQKSLHIWNGRIKKSVCPGFCHMELFRISDVNSVNLLREHPAC